MTHLKRLIAAAALSATASIAAEAAVTYTIVPGNDSASFIDALIDAGLDDEWMLMGKYDVVDDDEEPGYPGVFTGMTFDIDGVPGKSGTWESTFGVDAVAIKGGPNFILVDYTSIGSVFGDNWCTDGGCSSLYGGGNMPALLVGNGNNPDISHLTLYALKRIENGIPEPATWLMMIMGFGLAGIASRRRTTLRTS